MWLNRALGFLLLVSLAFPSGHCCRGRCTRATVVAVGSAVASSIVTGIATYWKKFHSYFEKQINDFSWNALGWSARTVQQKVTEGKFPPVKLLRNPPQHNCITRSEELTQLKELFDSFDTSTDDKVVYAVYLVGLPGSGKSELARQYGNLVFKSGEVSTVITLSTENEGQFQHDLIEALLEVKAAKGTKATKEELSKKEINYLVSELRLVLRERPGWLLIVDNIRNKNTTQSSFYKELPEPGSERWGQGYVLLTTQVLILEDGKFVKIKKANEGMTPNDAKQFLCELVKRGKGDCPDGDAEAIVKRLEYLPLAILAAGTFIERKLKLKSYTLAEYRENFDEENAKAFNISIPTKTDYPHSMQIALLLAVRNSVEGDFDASIVRDFCAFVGFTDEEETLSHLVQSYLEMKGHSEESIQKLIYFPLVDFLEEKKVFRVHQVTRDAFRAELIERSTRHSARGDLLLENFRDISHFFFTGYDEKDVEVEVGLWEVRTLLYFRYVLTHYDYSLNDIISPGENLDVAAFLMFKLVEKWFTFRSLCNCSELEIFVSRLLSAPENTTNAPHIRFTGCRLVHQCLKKDSHRDLSKKYAIKSAEMIKELVPESPELHAMPFFEKRYSFGIDFAFVIRFIQSVEPTDKEDSDRLYLSFFRVASVLYRWDTDKLGQLESMFLENGMLNGARVWFEEGILPNCHAALTQVETHSCALHLLGFSMTYLKLKQYTVAEDILLQARKYCVPVREQDYWLRMFLYKEDKVGCGVGCGLSCGLTLVSVQIRLHKYSESLSSLEEVLDEYGILLHRDWTRCVEVCGNIHRIRVATEVLERYQSLYANAPDSLHEVMRGVERKSMELLVEILSCEYLKDQEEARRPADGIFIILNESDKDLFRRLLHIIKKQISHNHTRNLTELTIGVAEILTKGKYNATLLVDELRVTVTTGLTLPLSVVNLLQDSIKKQVTPCPYPELTNFSLVAFTYFVSMVFLLATFALFKCVVRGPHRDRFFTLF